jgi:hypothetical protein
MDSSRSLSEKISNLPIDAKNFCSKRVSDLESMSYNSYDNNITNRREYDAFKVQEITIDHNPEYKEAIVKSFDSPSKLVSRKNRSVIKAKRFTQTLKSHNFETSLKPSLKKDGSLKKLHAVEDAKCFSFAVKVKQENENPNIVPGMDKTSPKTQQGYFYKFDSKNVYQEIRKEYTSKALSKNNEGRMKNKSFLQFVNQTSRNALRDYNNFELIDRKSTIKKNYEISCDNMKNVSFVRKDDYKSNLKKSFVGKFSKNDMDLTVFGNKGRVGSKPTKHESFTNPQKSKYIYQKSNNQKLAAADKTGFPFSFKETKFDTHGVSKMVAPFTLANPQTPLLKKLVKVPAEQIAAEEQTPNPFVESVESLSNNIDTLSFHNAKNEDLRNTSLLNTTENQIISRKALNPKEIINVLPFIVNNQQNKISEKSVSKEESRSNQSDIVGSLVYKIKHLEKKLKKSNKMVIELSEANLKLSKALIEMINERNSKKEEQVLTESLLDSLPHHKSEASENSLKHPETMQSKKIEENHSNF